MTAFMMLSRRYDEITGEITICADLVRLYALVPDANLATEGHGERIINVKPSCSRARHEVTLRIQQNGPPFDPVREFADYGWHPSDPGRSCHCTKAMHDDAIVCRGVLRKEGLDPPPQ
ncbi:Hypotetical protein [Gulosibacter molinativorax]|nr:Hypotetical protein [Gulosibacter molinativorax]